MDDKELFGCDCGCDDNENDCDCGCNDYDDDCDCGCDGHDEDILTITLEDGTEVDCAVLAMFPVEEKNYIALLPIDEEEDEEEVYFYEYKDSQDGIELFSIEPDDEYEKVTAAFDDLIEEADLEELLDDEDEE